MKIIAGLGNPALKYGGTRHNVGFGVIDELSDRWNIRVTDSRLRGLAGSGIIAGEKEVRAKGSAGGHNGMKSIIQHLGTIDYPRVRIGIGAKPPQMDLADYVLGHFPADELPVIRDSIKEAADAVEVILEEGMQPAMNRFNKIKGKENAKNDSESGSAVQPASRRA